MCSEYWKCGWRVWRVAGVFRVIRVFELWELEWTAIAGAWRDAASKATEREGRCDSRVAAALRQRSSSAHGNFDCFLFLISFSLCLRAINFNLAFN